MNIIFETKFGSTQYGTMTPTSDDDRKGIYLPTADDILFNRIKGTITSKRTKGEGEKNYAGEVDYEYYSLNRFFQLIREGQTVCLDVLFSIPETRIINSPLWEEIQTNRHRLISRKSQAFIGYCKNQANKYGVKGSRVAAIRKVLDYLKEIYEGVKEDRFLPPYYGAKLGYHSLYKKGFEEKFKNEEFISFPEIEQNSGIKVRYLEVCGRKLSYTASVKNALDVVQNLFDEYGHRALLAEKNEYIDWKALSHAVRIGQQAIELFETGFITFPRPNAEFLLEIKQGKRDYREIAEIIEDLFDEVEEASAKSNLPYDVDNEWIDSIIRREYTDIIMSDYGRRIINLNDCLSCNV